MFSYPTGLLFLFLGLTFWSFLDKRGRSGQWAMLLAFGGLAFYAFNLFASTAGMEQKFFSIFKDLILTALLAKVVSLIRSQPKLLLIVGVVVLFYHLYYKDKAHQQLMSVPTEQLAADSDWELLVDLKNKEDLAVLEQLKEDYDVQYKSAFQPKDVAATTLDDYYLVNIPNENKADILNKIKDFLVNNNKAIDGFENNETLNIAPIELQEPYVTRKNAYLNDASISQVWGFHQMKVESLYAMLSEVKPEKKARIAILDTGVDAKHEDIKDRFFSIESSYDKDNRGHGTHCAGIAAAVSNNGIGIASFAPNNDFVEVTSVKVLNSLGIGTQEQVIDGMITAADAGVDIISMSLGSVSSDSKQLAYTEAVRYCNTKGAIVIVAAGNESTNAMNISPANTPGVITVSAVDGRLNKASFSNTTQDLTWAVAAPGVNIFSTLPNDKYGALNGTSMATPYVAGLVAVMRAIQPELDTKTAFEILNSTGIATGATSETGRFIQANEAVKMLLD